MQCPACNFDQPTANRFCEECGAKMNGAAITPGTTLVLNGAQTCPNCGAIFTGEYCFKCGLERASAVENHIEIGVTKTLGGVSDIGGVRHRNEDCLALGSTNDLDVLVVCDGVSKSQQPDKAAHAAANCVCEGLLKSKGETDVKAAMLNALREADQAVRAFPVDPANPEEPSQTTIVAAVRHGNQLTLGWVGDSRAYWVAAAAMRQLTIDHSWANEVVTAGEMTYEQAMQHPNAHGITRTLGGRAGAAADEPSILQLEIGRELTRPGWLLLCTDGFWDSQSDPAKLAAFVMERITSHASGDDAVMLAKRLVEDACVARGHDNTTVALLWGNL